MFYLLEDNRIIDSEKYINSILNKGKNSEKNYEYLYEIRNGQSYYYGKIKKQSENVFGLIEKGDLVKYKSYFSSYIEEVIDIITKDIITKDMVIETGTEYVYEKDFLAIYKLDKKGNYIKVWEVH